MYDEMVDIPLDRLLQIGLADLHHNQAEFARIAKQLEPDEDCAADARAAGRGSPRARSVCWKVSRAEFDGLIDFLSSHHIITLPDGPRPTLQETPPFDASDHLRIDGYAWAARADGKGSLFLCDAAAEELGLRPHHGIHGAVQLSCHQQYRGARGLSRSLRPGSVDSRHR